MLSTLTTPAHRILADEKLCREAQYSFLNKSQCKLNKFRRQCIAVLIALIVISSVAFSQETSSSNPPAHVITTALELHSLTYEDSLHKYPIHLQNAVVLYYNPALGNLFIQDPTHGVYVDMR